MLHAYLPDNGGLRPLTGEDLTPALWVDLYRPLDRQTRQVEELGISVPTLADMEEIEISNRLYREDGVEYMTAVLPGELPDGSRVAMPVTFILTPQRLITVRHHEPRPFKTFPDRAGRATMGCASPDRLFLGLIEDIVARLADILEHAGKELEQTTSDVFHNGGHARTEQLQAALVQVGRTSDLIAKVRLGLLSLERVLAFYVVAAPGRPDSGRIKPVVKSLQRDIQALEVHADFLSSRIGLTADATLGMINLQQNNAVRMLSVVAALFLPPTLIASIYGMNFEHMPELASRWGYYIALGLMLLTSLATWLLMRWKRWL
ncbi:MAG: magnesium transporter CorA family protein [Paracoccus sp. (in: a-proteobacteria)]|uniref:magnesium transporter CorA family protein n=1 Tax=Paracoccus sp. TaxID=267 RepID=UPI0026DF909D|nr:magnesium transporter CorA family protein [Paracoccus sp. (in: a-proteobacteria)]MDO5612253.1 magnesium transporter CorA family protein [Paracoccus sp. (in: a-proteobacteria)]